MKCQRRHGKNTSTKLLVGWDYALEPAALPYMACGASLHGLRHAYAQARHKDLTNLPAPCLYSSPSDYREAPYQEHDDTWRNRHDQAINILAHELGHNRGEITATYLVTIHG
ncbi:hypothetical protein ACQ0P8_13485 [Halodesulfovibrio aestuarii]|uniref:hypothetical protein n=1 Tax=Halodesulfovibrio aestuarii TaxID=126333 RepID=UPI001F36FB43|nr:hypothetical protein [Halodesulfovibrio aestuarii]